MRWALGPLVGLVAIPVAKLQGLTSSGYATYDSSRTSSGSLLTNSLTSSSHRSGRTSSYGSVRSSSSSNAGRLSQGPAATSEPKYKYETIPANAEEGPSRPVGSDSLKACLLSKDLARFSMKTHHRVRGKFITFEPNGRGSLWWGPIACKVAATSTQQLCESYRGGRFGKHEACNHDYNMVNFSVAQAIVHLVREPLSHLASSFAQVAKLKPGVEKTTPQAVHSRFIESFVSRYETGGQAACENTDQLRVWGLASHFYQDPFVQKRVSFYSIDSFLATPPEDIDPPVYIVVPLEYFTMRFKALLDRLADLISRDSDAGPPSPALKIESELLRKLRHYGDPHAMAHSHVDTPHVVNVTNVPSFAGKLAEFAAIENRGKVIYGFGSLLKKYPEIALRESCDLRRRWCQFEEQTYACLADFYALHPLCANYEKDCFLPPGAAARPRSR